jgi:hypothetical protein
MCAVTTVVVPVVVVGSLAIIAVAVAVFIYR